MNMKNIKNASCLLSFSFLAFAFLSACAVERTVTREVSESGPGWSQTGIVQEYKNPRESIQDKQIIQEKIRCVSGKTGSTIPCQTKKECVSKGGKIVNEVITDEYSSVRKR